jgi:hypothetical protein
VDKLKELVEAVIISPEDKEAVDRLNEALEEIKEGEPLYDTLQEIKKSYYSLKFVLKLLQAIICLEDTQNYSEREIFRAKQVFYKHKEKQMKKGRPVIK